MQIFEIRITENVLIIFTKLDLLQLEIPRSLSRAVIRRVQMDLRH